MLNIRKEQLARLTVIVGYSFLLGVMPHAFVGIFVGPLEERVEAVQPVDPLVKFRNAQSLTETELKELLKAVGFEGPSLKVAWTVAMKESNGRPKAHNDNLNTGDNSYGIFQINMLGSLGEDRRELFNLTSNSELFDPVTNAQAAYYMTAGGTDWSSWKVVPGKNNGERYNNLFEQYPRNNT